MQELDFINQHLGGHKITLNGLKRMAIPNREWRIVEIGCGGGNNLRIIKRWCEANNIEAHLTGIDINPECIDFAKVQTANRDIQFICCDYRDASFDVKPDVIFNSLFCHHFTDKELKLMLQWMYANTTHGFFINDLHRHPLAYYSIKVLTKLFSKSYLVKNDAPLSVKRGFSKRDWLDIFEASGIRCQIEWQWAFRWLISCRK